MPNSGAPARCGSTPQCVRRSVGGKKEGVVLSRYRVSRLSHACIVHCCINNECDACRAAVFCRACTRVLHPCVRRMVLCCVCSFQCTWYVRFIFAYPHVRNAPVVYRGRFSRVITLHVGVLWITRRMRLTSMLARYTLPSETHTHAHSYGTGKWYGILCTQSIGRVRKHRFSAVYTLGNDERNGVAMK